jgi:hypothetical protein
MRRKFFRTQIALTAIVLIHLAITIIHGSAHNGAHVPLSAAGTAFVFIVILAGPLFGIALAWFRRIGAWIVALTMLGALVFGLVNHFMLDGPDHVRHVDMAWRSLFLITAALLAVTELCGFGLAIRWVRERSIV